jgi:alpha-tubulin suppressor-like RCC1 family protein
VGHVRLRLVATAVAVVALAPANALASGGELISWGYNGKGQLGIGSGQPTGSPTAVDLGGSQGTIAAVASGETHSLAITSTGSLLVWGSDAEHELGLGGDNASETTPQPGPTLPGATGLPKLVAAGDEDSFAVTTTGQLYGWGLDNLGQLGNGEAGTGTTVETPVQITGVGTVEAIAAGPDFTLVENSDAEVYAFGDNATCQLGTGAASTDVDTPQLVLSQPGINTMAAGKDFALVNTEHGLYGWGDNADSQLGLGNAGKGVSKECSPVSAGSGLSDIEKLEAGAEFGMALTTAGSLYAWGTDADGALGVSGSFEEQPTKLGTPPSAPTVIDGETDDAFAEDGSGQLYSWGNNVDGQLGQGSEGTGIGTPAAASLPATAELQALAQGSSAQDTLALVADPSVTTASLPSGAVGTAYDETVSAEGGLAPYTWSATGLPAGLSIDPSSGEITGTPTTSAGYTPDVTVTDSAGLTYTADYAVQIGAGSGPPDTSTSLSPSQNPTTVGTQVTYTATVSPTPDGGTVEFTDDGSVLGSCSMVSLTNGTAMCSTTYTTASSGDSIVATYSGDNDFAGSTSSTLTETINPEFTQATLKSSENPANVGDQITYTATISPTPDGGTVTFTDNNKAIGNCEDVVLSGDQATCEMTYGTFGAHSIVADYSGDDNYAQAFSSPLTENVLESTMTSITPPTASPTVASPMTVTATVTPAPDGGTVRFWNGFTTYAGCGAVALSGAGKASCTITPTSATTYPVLADYSGNSDFVSSGTVYYLQVGKAPTTAHVTLPSTVYVGQPATITMTVTPTPDGGTVTLFNEYDGVDNRTVMPGCNDLPVTNGKATCQTTFTSVSTTQDPNYVLTAYYGGDANYAASSLLVGSVPTVLLGTFSNTAIGISLAQAAGDPAQTNAGGGTVNYNGVPLVAGHATLARVFIEPAGIDASVNSGLVGTLSGSVNGHALPGSPLQADTGGPRLLTTMSIADQLGLENTSFNFLLPSSWTAAGKNVTLTATVAQKTPAPAGAQQCGSHCNVSLTLTDVKFATQQTFEVTPVELTYQGIGGVVAPASPGQVMALAYATLPVDDIVTEGYQTTIDISSFIGQKNLDANAVNKVKQWAIQQFESDGDVNKLHQLVEGFDNGELVGLTDYDDLLGTNSHGNKVYEPIAVAESLRPISSVAHEMAHGIGRRHADTLEPDPNNKGPGCGGPEGGGSDKDWPDDLGHLEPTTNFVNGPSTSGTPTVGSYGVNLAWRVPETSGKGPFVIIPDTAYDFMSYCAGIPDYNNPPTAASPGSDWISARGWAQEFTCLSKSPPAADCPQSEDDPNATAGGTPEPVESAADASAAAASGGGDGGPPIKGPSISFLGYIDPLSGQLEAPALMPAQGGAAGATQSMYKASLVSASGSLIATEPLGGETLHTEPGRKTPAQAMIGLQGFIPTHGQQVGGLVVSVQGKKLAEIHAPTLKPRVTVRTPRIGRHTKTITVRWNSHDRDHVALNVFLSFSTNGRSWHVLWVGGDTGQAKLALTAFAGARRGRLRVSVSDGFMESVATTKRFRLPAPRASRANARLPRWLIELERDGLHVSGSW